MFWVKILTLHFTDDADKATDGHFWKTCKYTIYLRKVLPVAQ